MLFIFDENYPPEFVKGFSILEKANKKSPIRVDVVFSVDFMGGPRLDQTTGKRLTIEDRQIIVAAAQQQAVIVTHDADFKRIKLLKSLLAEHSVGYVYFKTPKKYVYWDYVKRFVNNWEEIKLAVSEARHPFAFELGKTGGISKLEF